METEFEPMPKAKEIVKLCQDLLGISSLSTGNTSNNSSVYMVPSEGNWSDKDVIFIVCWAFLVFLFGLFVGYYGPRIRYARGARPGRSTDSPYGNYRF